MSDSMKYNFGGIEGAASSGVSREESLNPQGLDLTPDEELELDEQTTLVPLNEALCGAKNVQGSLRWLKGAERFTADAAGKHQLIYVMDGQGLIRLNDKDYEVEKGGGIYLGPAETATIQAGASASLKLFHLVVPQIPK